MSVGLACQQTIKNPVSNGALSFTSWWTLEARGFPASHQQPSARGLQAMGADFQSRKSRLRSDLYATG